MAYEANEDKTRKRKMIMYEPSGGKNEEDETPVTRRPPD